jgi:hypothetical protein
MAKVLVSNLSLSGLASLLRLTSRGCAVLALPLMLAFGSTASADCSELLFGSSTLSEKIYRDSLTQTALPAAGVLPEEVLALLGREAGAYEPRLFEIFKELNITQVRWGSRFKVTGLPFRKARTLVLKRQDFSTPEKKAKYLTQFAHALFKEKQRQLRFADPVRYVNSMDDFSLRLEQFVGAGSPLARPKFNALTYTLRGVFGFLPGVHKQFPATKPRMALHYTLTRAFAALIIGTMAINVTEIPQAIETVQTLIQMQDVIGGVVQDMGNMEYNAIQDRLDIISMYEGRILELEASLEGADPEDVQFINERVATFKVLIESLRADLDKLKPPA